MTAHANTSRNIPPFCKAELADRERLAYDMLLRWFLGLNVQGGSFEQLAHAVTGRFFGAVVREARRQCLLS